MYNISLSLALSVALPIIFRFISFILPNYLETSPEFDTKNVSISVHAIHYLLISRTVKQASNQKIDFCL